MSFIARDTSRDFLPAPAGLHTARLVEIIDLGIPDNDRYGRNTAHHRIRLVFQLEERLPDAPDQCYTVSAFHSLTVSPKSTLKPFLESWLGRRLTARELDEGFDLAALVNRPAYVMVVHTEKNNATYADITSVMPLPPGLVFHFPAMIRQTGEVIAEDLRSNDQADRTSTTDARRTDRASERSRQAPRETSAGEPDVPPARTLREANQAGLAAFGNAWPTERARILRALGLSETVERLTPEQMGALWEAVQAEREEHRERAALMGSVR